jgi:hypothetical protein
MGDGDAGNEFGHDCSKGHLCTLLKTRFPAEPA